MSCRSFFKNYFLRYNTIMMHRTVRASSWVPIDLTKNVRRYTAKPVKIPVHGKNVAVYWHDDGPRIVNDVCAHRGASLSAGGQITEKGCVKCKYHGHDTSSLSSEIVVERDGIVWLRSGEPGWLPPHETNPPTSWEFETDRDLRVFEYSRCFKGCNPVLTVENTLDFSHLDSVHSFHLIEGRPDVSITRRGYHGQAIYKYKSKVFKLAIENEYLGPWSSCLRFMFDDMHSFTLHFAVRPESRTSSTLFVRVSRSVHKLPGAFADLAYMLINELPLWEDKYIVENVDPSSWSENKLTRDDDFLKGYRQYMVENHHDLLSYYVR